MHHTKTMFLLFFCLSILAGSAAGIEAKPLVEVCFTGIYHRLHDEAFIVIANGRDADGNDCSRHERLPIDQYFPNADFFPGPFDWCYGACLIYQEGDDCYVVGYSALEPHHYGSYGSQVTTYSGFMTDWGFDPATQKFYVDIDPEQLPRISAEHVEHLTEQMVVGNRHPRRPSAPRTLEELRRRIDEASAERAVKPIVEVVYREINYFLSGGICLVIVGLDEDENEVFKWRDLPRDQFFANARLYESILFGYDYSTHLIYRHGTDHYLIGHTIIKLPEEGSQQPPTPYTAFLTDWGFDLETQEIYVNTADLEKLPKMPPGSAEPLRPGMITEKLLYEKLHGRPGATGPAALDNLVKSEEIW